MKENSEIIPVTPATLDGVYKAHDEISHGAHVLRWSETPYMSPDVRESIFDHSVSGLYLGDTILSSSDYLKNVVDRLAFFRIFLWHDTGETRNGDISAYVQLNGHGKNKHIDERQQLSSMLETLEPHVQKEVLTMFDLFESPVSEINNVEVLFARLIDNLQGDAFALKHGKNLKEYSDITNKILKKRFTPVAKRFIEVLDQRGLSGARDEVVVICNHHLEQMRQTGIVLDIDEF